MQAKRLAAAFLTAAMVFSGSFSSLTLHSMAEEGEKQPVIKGEYAKNQAIVKFRADQVSVSKGSKELLSAARALDRVSEDFGNSMKASGSEGLAASTVRDQTDILDDCLRDDFVIEDTVCFDGYEGKKPLIYSLVSSDRYDTETIIKKLSANPAVESVIPNSKISCEAISDYSLNDEYSEYLYQQNSPLTNNTSGDSVNSRGYDPKTMASQNISELWKKTEKSANSRETVVAVIDTGVDSEHEDLKDRMWHNPGNIGLLGSCGYDFVENSSDVYDGNGHGTHCAGIIAAKANNAVGVAGEAGNANVKIMALRVLDENGSGGGDYYFTVIGAFNYILRAKQRGVNIVAANCSFGWGPNYASADDCREIIGRLGQEGINLMVAAGNNALDNDRVNTSFATTDCDNAITVGSMSETERPSPFSNFGNTSVDVFTPGQNILSTVSEPVFFPCLYDPAKLRATTEVYAEFTTGTEAPVAGDNGHDNYTGVQTFKAPQTEVPSNVTSSLETVGSNFFNNSTKPASLKWTIKNAKPGQKCYIYFPYEKSRKADGAFLSMAYQIDCGGAEIYSRTGEMIRKKDGSVEAYEPMSEKLFSDRQNMLERHIVNNNLFTYSEVGGADVASYGVGIELWVPEDMSQSGNDYSVYFDHIGISKAGVDEDEFGKYDVLSGTSMAAPAACGALAVLASNAPEGSAAAGGLTGAEYAAFNKNRLLSCTTHSKALEGMCSTEGYIDFARLDENPPAISDAVVNPQKATVTLKGTGFGSAQRSELFVKRLSRDVSYRPLAEESGSEMYVTWNSAGTAVTIHNASELMGTYTRFKIACDGMEGTGSFFLVKGERVPPSLTKIGSFIPMQIMTDKNGQNLYVMDEMGTVSRYDSSKKEFIRRDTAVYDDFNGALREYVEDALDSPRYGTANDIFSWNSIAAVHIGNTMYHFVDASLGAETVTLLAKCDFTKNRISWSFSEVKTPEEGLYPCTAGGKIYSLGGLKEENGELELSKSVYRFNESDGTWQKLSCQLPEKFAVFNKVSYGKNTYLMFCRVCEDSIWESTESSGIWKFDGSSFTKMNTELLSPFRHKYNIYNDGSSDNWLNPALCEAKNGIICFGASVDGLGNAFRYDPDADRLYPINATIEGGLTGACSNAGVVTAEGFYLFREEYEDSLMYVNVYRIDAGSDTFTNKYVLQVSSKASLAKSSAAIKRGGSCTIKVKNANGQKVTYSLPSSAKKKGISVSSKGVVRASKKSKTGTYKVTVKLAATAKYKAKTLVFTVKVKK